MLLSYKYRLYPTRAQCDALGAMLSDFCGLYNAGLQQRIEAYRRRGLSLGYTAQANELRAVRALNYGFERWSYSAEQQVLRRLDKAFRAFFGRIKRAEKPGFPRFRASTHWHAAEFRVGDGLTLRKNGRIGIVGIPAALKIKWHRALPSDPKSAIVTRQNGKWFAIFHVEVAAGEHRGARTVSLDFGLTSLVAFSTGETVERPNWTKRAAKGLRRRQRALARCQRGSKRRAKRKALLCSYHKKIANKRHDYLHKLSRQIVDRFDRIGVEDLPIKALARGMQAKHVNDAAWAQLVSMLDYKAENAGGQVIKVDPRGTSRECPACGHVAAKTLDERRHRCACGADLDRDVAAAIVVHIRAFGFGPGTGLGTLSERIAA